MKKFDSDDWENQIDEIADVIADQVDKTPVKAAEDSDHDSEGIEEEK